MPRPEIKCPHCKNRMSNAETQIWPFCSERCKKLDLGDWASEKFKISSNQPQGENDDEEDSTELFNLEDDSEL